MEEAAAGVLLAWSIVIATFHWWRTKADVVLLCQQVLSYIQQVRRSILHSNLSRQTSAKRVDEAMNLLREENYVLTCRILQHATLLTLITIPMTYGQDLATCAGMMLLGLFSYGMHTSLANGSLRLSANSLRYLFGAYYLMIIAFLWFFPHGAGEQTMTHQKTILAAQFAAVVCFADSTVNVPGQIAMMVAEVARYGTTNGWNLGVLEFMVGQMCLTLMIMATSVVHEHTLRSRKSAEIRHVDAESMISSFRRLLRGVCDAEMLLDEQKHRLVKTARTPQGTRLLDEQLCIQDDGAGLNRLLSINEGLQGKKFEDFLVHDEKEMDRFRSFISRWDELETESAAPPCLRVSLQSSSGRLGVDIFHVVVPHNGCNGPCHLLAMKLDTECFAECYAVPEAEVFSNAGSPQPSTPTTPASFHRQQSPPSRTSDLSDSTALLQTPGLKEMMLLVDVRDQLGVLQVHLSYKDRQRKRGRSSRRSADGSHRSMPLLRSFVRPTDWGTVCQQVQGYASRHENSEQSLGRLWIRMLERPSTYMVAQQARLKPTGHAEGVQCWLHLKDLRQTQQVQRAPSELEDIGEAGQAESESS